MTLPSLTLPFTALPTQTLPYEWKIILSCQTLPSHDPTCQTLPHLALTYHAGAQQTTPGLVYPQGIKNLTLPYLTRPTLNSPRRSQSRRAAPGHATPAPAWPRLAVTDPASFITRRIKSLALPDPNAPHLTAPHLNRSGRTALDLTAPRLSNRIKRLTLPNLAQPEQTSPVPSLSRRVIRQSSQTSDRQSLTGALLQYNSSKYYARKAS